jgi:hypothetical protein
MGAGVLAQQSLVLNHENAIFYELTKRIAAIDHCTNACVRLLFFQVNSLL